MKTATRIAQTIMRVESSTPPRANPSMDYLEGWFAAIVTITEELHDELGNLSGLIYEAAGIAVLRAAQDLEHEIKVNEGKITTAEDAARFLRNRIRTGKL